MIAFSGSTKNHLDRLSPIGIGGDNGSYDGIGVYLCKEPNTALRYAGAQGSVYMADVPIDDYLLIDQHTTLTRTQQDAFMKKFMTLPDHIQWRLATDISGFEPYTFSYEDESKAKDFYKQAKADFSTMPGIPDRVKPRVEFEKDHITVMFPSMTPRLDQVNTKHLHYVLNLHCNHTSTELMRTCAPGLVIQRESGDVHYLSFSDLPVTAKVQVQQLSSQQRERQLNNIATLLNHNAVTDNIPDINDIPSFPNIDALNKQSAKENLGLNIPMLSCTTGLRFVDILIEQCLNAEITCKPSLAPVDETKYVSQHSVEQAPIVPSMLLKR